MITGCPKRYRHISIAYNLKNWITYENLFHITKGSIKCNFLNNFGKTVNLTFNGLIGVNSLRSIYFTKHAKKKVPPNLSENCQTFLTY